MERSIIAVNLIQQNKTDSWKLLWMQSSWSKMWVILMVSMILWVWGSYAPVGCKCLKQRSSYELYFFAFIVMCLNHWSSWEFPFWSSHNWIWPSRLSVHYRKSGTFPQLRLALYKALSSFLCLFIIYSEMQSALLLLKQLLLSLSKADMLF